MPCKLTAINHYPLKGGRAVALATSAVEDRGLAGDRRWMVVDTQGGFLSQRSDPKLALIQASLDNRRLSLSAPGQPQMVLEQGFPGERLAVRVWRDQVSAVTCPSESDAWLSDYLEKECRLVYMDDAAQRPVRDDSKDLATLVSFADGYPLLVVSEASLELLNSKLESPVPMDRFRPNLVISGCQPHQEDTFSELRIGAAVIRAVKPCSRCQVPTIDQESGLAAESKEPLKTLASYRTQQEGVLFGMNYYVAQPGRINLDDDVEILS